MERALARRRTNSAGTAPDPMNALVRRARSGDRAAFEQLYRENVGRVYALCLRVSAEPVRAEELAQDVFVRAWRKLRSFRGESAFSTWLYRLTMNVVFEVHRSDRRRAARVIPMEDLDSLERGNPGMSPEAGIDLEQAIQSLPPRARAIFVLHDIEGYRHHEIAEIMGLAPGTSKAQLHRARKLLQETLEL